MKKLKNIFKKIIITGFVVMSFILLLSFTKGQKGDPLYYQKENDTRITSPFESSNSTSRYALTQAIVEDHTFFLSTPLAKFSSPDVVDYKGKFFSIFTPGVSFIGVPFYIVGKLYDIPQLTTYLAVALFAFLNMFLVARLAYKFGAGFYESLLSGFVFLFASNALAYALSFTQHHMSVTVILLSLMNATEERTLLRDIALGALFGIGLLLDIPNAILLFPIILYVLFKHFSIETVKKKVKLSLRLSIIGLLIGVLPLIAGFAYYNFQTTGSYTKLGQFIGQTHYFRTTLAVQNPVTSSQSVSTPKGVKLFDIPFKTRNQFNGLYILLLSNERAWLFYSPILLFGLFGFFFAYKESPQKDLLLLLIAVIVVNITLYSMFDDPWGGWAFGPRYLIPAAALMASGIGVALTKYRRNIIFLLSFVITLIYSIYVSSLGALTTSAIPPKVEATSFKPALDYTFSYTYQFLNRNVSGNLVYNLFLSGKMSEWTYVIILDALVVMYAGFLFILFLTTRKEGA